VIVLGFDTATPATAVALRRADGTIDEDYREAPEGARPLHAQLLLATAAVLLERAGLDWRQIDRLAAGVGPGGYTGLRIGLATARGIAQSSGAELVGVGTLRALAEPVTGRAAAAVLDARRGEAFVAVYRDGGEEVLPPRTCRPEEIAGLALAGGPHTLAIGDGAQRYRESIEGGGIEVAPAASGLHRLSAASICRLAAAGNFGPANPDYLRLADAEIALGAPVG
jgi:tRNA threonylcarbamoyladenosine biosynthesis protein TsaB